MADRSVTFKPAGPVLSQFMADESFVRGIMGPLGSSKSSTCVVEVLRRAAMQTHSPDGLRKTRWGIIRNSYPELKTTTLKTWFEWCPQEYGKVNMDSPIIHHVRVGDLDMEVLFLALDRPEDAKKLLSLELTGAFLNEAREIDKGILDALTGRVGRYPSRNQGGATWSGIIMDTNPPDDQSWWYHAAEVETPKGWKFFRQPSGDSPQAENIENLPKDYYERIKAGKDDDWIKVYVRGEYGFVTEGKPVYPMFRDRIHVAVSPIIPAKGIPLILGVDFGLTPAAVIAQKLADGRWLIIDELISTDCGNIRFAETLAKYIATTYPDHHIELAIGDPAGNKRADSDERTSFEIMKEYTGWKCWRPAPTNDWTPRREVVIAALNRLVDGNPGLLISPKCATLRKAFSGGYHFKFIKTGNGTQLHESPNKNQYSHVSEALQYLLLGGGEFQVIMRKDQHRNRGQDRVPRDVNYDPFSGSKFSFSE